MKSQGALSHVRAPSCLSSLLYPATSAYPSSRIGLSYHQSMLLGEMRLGYERQGAVVLHLVLELGELGEDLLALVGLLLFGAVAGPDRAVDIVDRLSLLIQNVSFDPI